MKGLCQMPNDEVSQVREAVAVFDSAETLEAAIDELQSSGFDRAEISLLAGEKTVTEMLGRHYKRVADLEDDPSVPSKAFVSTEAIGDAEGALIGALLYVGAVTLAGAVVASGGALAAAITAAAIGGGVGGLGGIGLSSFISQHHADYLQEQLDRGGLLLWVRTRDPAHETRAQEILRRHSAHDVHIHGIQRT
jgi:hypothetical protein